MVVLISLQRVSLNDTLCHTGRVSVLMTVKTRCTSSSRQLSPTLSLPISLPMAFMTGCPPSGQVDHRLCVRIAKTILYFCAAPGIYTGHGDSKNTRAPSILIPRHLVMLPWLVVMCPKVGSFTLWI